MVLIVNLSLLSAIGANRSSCYVSLQYYKDVQFTGYFPLVISSFKDVCRLHYSTRLLVRKANFYVLYVFGTRVFNYFIAFQLSNVYI